MTLVASSDIQEASMADANARLNELKQKYQSVIHAMEQQHVQLQNLNMEGAKLFIRGVAPSEEAKNKVWDQIKLVDASYSDLIADINVDQSRQTTAQSTSQPTAPATSSASTRAASGGTYTVRPGDTLSKISKEAYGDPNQYMRIFEANRDKLKDPDMIQVGQQLVIPKS
jgi:LysM repeat protein